MPPLAAGANRRRLVLVPSKSASPSRFPASLEDFTFVRGLVFSALVLAPSLAAAECAWVLWATAPGANVVTSLPIDAFKTREECDAEKASRDVQAKVHSKNEGRSSGAAYLAASLPDTVDARGPKTK